MRCIKCKASYEEHYAESYCCDWYCLAGVDDNDRDEDRNGDLGCNLHYKTIEKLMAKNEEAEMKDKEAFVDWYLENEHRFKTSNNQGGNT